MRRERVEKLRRAMESAGVDVLLCCAQNNVSYATGARVPAADQARALHYVGTTAAMEL